MKNDDFNKNAWTFMYLIINNPEFLSMSGKIIKYLVENNGKCGSISKVAKHLNKPKISVSYLCKKLGNYIITQKEGNKKTIVFNNFIIVEAEQWRKSIFRR